MADLTDILPEDSDSLTLYIAHIAFIWTLEPFAGIITGKTSVLMLVTLFLILYTVFIRQWFKTASKGPIETLMRKFDPAPPLGIHLNVIKGGHQ